MINKSVNQFSHIYQPCLKHEKIQVKAKIKSDSTCIIICQGHLQLSSGCCEYSPDINWHVELSPWHTPQISTFAEELIFQSQPIVWKGTENNYSQYFPC